MGQPFPAGWRESPSAFVCIPAVLLPYLQAGCELLKRSPRWNDEDRQEAVKGLTYMQRGIAMAMCAKDLIESQNRIYRLLEARLTGKVYSWSVGDMGEIIISPEIPIVPDPNPTAAMMLQWELLDTRLNNAFFGVVSPGYPENEGVMSLLRQILQKIGEDDTNPEDIAEIIELLGQIAVLVG